MKIKAFVIVFVLLVSSIAFAQAPGAGWVIGPDGGWLPPDNPVARAVMTQAPQAPTVVPVEVLTGCDFPSPYVSGPNTSCLIGTYRIGRIYAFGQVEKAQVIGLSVLPNGVEVVTVAFLDALGTHRGGPDFVWSFKNDGTYRPWTFTHENGY